MNAESFDNRHAATKLPHSNVLNSSRTAADFRQSMFMEGGLKGVSSLHVEEPDTRCAVYSR